MDMGRSVHCKRSFVLHVSKEKDWPTRREFFYSKFIDKFGLGTLCRSFFSGFSSMLFFYE